MGPQFLSRDITACLPEYGPQGAGVEFPMTWDSERLFLTRWSNAPQLHMTSPLGMKHKPEVFQNTDHLSP